MVGRRYIPAGSVLYWLGQGFQEQEVGNETCENVGT